jgi:hypothetical protein
MLEVDDRPTAFHTWQWLWTISSACPIRATKSLRSKATSGSTTVSGVHMSLAIGSDTHEYNCWQPYSPPIA